MSSEGAERIAAERQRQVEVEGWTAEHDARHHDTALLDAASGYMSAAVWEMDTQSLGYTDNARHPLPANWPWDPSWWKPGENPIRNLEKAGALIAAEIDRLLRVEWP